MRLYRIRSTSKTALDFSDDLIIGLDQFPKTKALTPAVQRAHDNVAAAQAAVVAAERPARRAAKLRRLSEYELERAIDQLLNTCKAKDTTANGPIERTVFPDGVMAEKQPKGQAQLESADVLRKRIANSEVEEVKASAASLLELIDPALERFREAVKAWQSARKVLREAMDIEDQRVIEHRATMDSTFGAIRAAFPTDRRIQDLVAPEMDDDPTAKAPEPTPAPTPEPTPET